MRRRFALFLMLGIAPGGCGQATRASSEPPAHGSALSEAGGARLSYRSQRKGRNPDRERALAQWALRTFCGHDRDFACANGEIVDVEIVSNAKVGCAIIAVGQKFRVAEPQERTSAIAEFDCEANGGAMRYREEFYPPGTAGVTMDGPFAPRPRDLTGTPPILVDTTNPASLKPAEPPAESSEPDHH